jgi:hypothetical protein
MHYSVEEWRMFADDLVSHEMRILMENHLACCDQCLGHYLSCITPDRQQQAQERLDPGFTGKIIAEISLSVGKKQYNNKRNNGRDVIFYYAAAACITLFLMGIGVFEDAAEALIQVSKAGIPEDRLIHFDMGEIVEFGWTDKLMHKTLTLVDSIKPKE